MAEVDERVSPRTEAGRRLAVAMKGWAHPVNDDILLDYALAIEAEAIALRDAELAAAVENIDDLLLDALDQVTGWTSNTSNREARANELIEEARRRLRLITGKEGADHAD